MKSGAYTRVRACTTGSGFPVARMDVTVPCILEFTGLIVFSTLLWNPHLYLRTALHRPNESWWSTLIYNSSALPQTMFLFVRSKVHDWSLAKLKLFFSYTALYKLLYWSWRLNITCHGIPSLIGNPHHPRHSFPSLQVTRLTVNQYLLGQVIIN